MRGMRLPPNLPFIDPLNDHFAISLALQGDLIDHFYQLNSRQSASIIAPSLLKTFSNSFEILLQGDRRGCLIQSQKRFLGIQNLFDFALLFGLAFFSENQTPSVPRHVRGKNKP